MGENMSTRYRGHRIVAGAEIGWLIPDLNLIAMNLAAAIAAINLAEGKSS